MYTLSHVCKVYMLGLQSARIINTGNLQVLTTCNMDVAGVVVPDEAAPMETDSIQEAPAQRDMVCMRCKICIASCNTLLHYTNTT